MEINFTPENQEVEITEDREYTVGVDGVEMGEVRLMPGKWAVSFPVFSGGLLPTEATPRSSP